MIKTYEETISVLKEFGKLNLSKLDTFDAQLNDMSKNDMIELYKLLEMTRQHLDQLQAALEN